MKSTLKTIGLMTIAVWFAGLSLYYGKKVAFLKTIATQATDGFAQG